MIRRNSFELVLAVILIFLPLVVTAGDVDLPKTGQTTVYSSGDDGDLQKGVAWPSPRFTDNSDGTVSDNLTGLVWLKNANCAGTMTWNDALDYCNTLASGSCGLTDGSVAGDWRLPNIVELESLINANESNSAAWLNTQGFSSIQSSNYWSATTDALGTDTAWRVHMYVGYVSHSTYKSDSYCVWPVRTGQ